MMKFLRTWWPTMIVVAVIVYATINDNPTPDMDFNLFAHADKLIHAVMFGGLTGAVFFDRQRAHTTEPLTVAFKLKVCAVILVGAALDEWAQNAITASRQGDLYDWLADALGIAVAYFTAPPAVRAVLRIKKPQTR